MVSARVPSGSARALLHWEGANFKVVFVKFMSVFVTRRDSALLAKGCDTIAALTPVNKNIL